jgi:uncharacterized protein (TIRG00374 family)
MVRRKVPLAEISWDHRMARNSMAATLWLKVGFAALGIALGCACFWLAARNVDVGEAGRIFVSSDWGWVLAGTCLFGGDLCFRVARWRLIMSHKVDIAYLPLGRGLLVGYAVNILLPARLGELFRADYTARLTHVARSAVLGSIFVERLVDLMAVLILVAVGLALAGIHSPAIYRATLIGTLIFGAAVVFTYATLRVSRGTISSLLRAGSKFLSEPIATRFIEIVSEFGGLLEIVQTRRLVGVLLLTIPIWMFEAVAVFCICGAIGLPLGPASLMLLLGGTSLSTLFPSAPGFSGSYQFAYVVILGNFGVSDTLALVAATGAQVYLMGFYTLLGIAVWTLTPLLTSWASGWRTIKPASMVKGVGRATSPG